MSPNQAFSSVSKPIFKILHVWDYCDYFTFLLKSPQNFTPNSDLSLNPSDCFGTCLPKAAGFSPLGTELPRGGAAGTVTLPLAVSLERDCQHCLGLLSGGWGALRGRSGTALRRGLEQQQLGLCRVGLGAPPGLSGDLTVLPPPQSWPRATRSIVSPHL